MYHFYVLYRHVKASMSKGAWNAKVDAHKDLHVTPSPPRAHTSKTNGCEMWRVDSLAGGVAV